MSDARPVTTSPVPRATWEAVLATHPDPIVGQSPAWRDAVLSDGAYADASVHYAFPGGRQVVLPLARRRHLRAGVASWPQRWGNGGPITSDGRIGPQEARAVLHDLVRRAGPSAALTLGHNTDPAWLAAAAAPGGTTWEAAALGCYVLDLDGGFDTVWTRRFRGTARTAVRKAEKSGLDIECDRTGRLVEVYDALLDRSVRRRAEDENEPLWLARLRMSRVSSAPRQTALVARCFGSACTTWVARRGGEPVAAIVVLEAGPYAKYWRGAMDRDLGRGLRANELLHRLAIEDVCARGRRSYDMGGAEPGTPLGEFKAKLGAVPASTHELRARRLPARAAHRARTRAEVLVKRAAGLREM